MPSHSSCDYARNAINCSSLVKHLLSVSKNVFVSCCGLSKYSTGVCTSTWSLPDADAEIVLWSGFNFACELVNQEELYCSRFQCPPDIFAGLLRPEYFEDTLSRIKQIWEKYLEIEQLIPIDDAWAEELASLIWPVATWCLEILLALAENGYVSEWVKADIALMQELREWAQSLRSTKPCEDGFNSCRGVSTGKASKMEADRVMHTLHNSKIAKENDVPISKISNLAKSTSGIQVPPDCYKARQKYRILPWRRQHGSVHECKDYRAVC